MPWSAADGKVVYILRNPTVTGRTALRMTPQQSIGRLAALTPPPWFKPMRLIAVIKDPQAIAAILGHPDHRDDDPESGPDPPQLALDLHTHLEAFELD